MQHLSSSIRVRALLCLVAITSIASCIKEPIEARWYIVPRGFDCDPPENNPPGKTATPDDKQATAKLPPCMVIAVVNRDTTRRTIRNIRLSEPEPHTNPSAPEDPPLATEMVLERGEFRVIKVPKFECKLPSQLSYTDESDHERPISLLNKSPAFPLQVLHRCTIDGSPAPKTSDTHASPTQSH